MSAFTQNIFSGSRTLFWGIVPLGGLLVLSMNMFPPEQNHWILWVIDVVFVLFALGLWNPLRFRAAARIVCGAVCLLYLGYVVDQIRLGNRVEEAALGLVVIGVPAGIYAVRGRFATNDGPTGEWITSLNHCGDLRLLRDTFTAVIESASRPTHGMSLRALIVAELLATRRGYPVEELPFPLRGWPAGHRNLETEQIIPVALAAVDRILGDSELRDRWEREGLIEAFQSEIAKLHRFLI